MKKNYMKASMKVIKLQNRSQLLVGSVPEYPDRPFSYAPGIDDDMSRMA